MRQLGAWLLGSFFSEIRDPDGRTGAMKAFGNMGEFCRVEKTQWWKPGDLKPQVGREAMIQLPDSPWNRTQQTVADTFLGYLGWLRDIAPVFREQAQSLLADTPLLNRAIDGWSELIADLERSFEMAIEQWRRDYDVLLNAWKDVESNLDDSCRRANAIHRQLATLYGVTVIESLSNSQFLPRYGFPINVHRLRVQVWDEDHKKVRDEEQYRLERGGLLAIREYAPGATLMVGGKFVTSRGLTRMPYLNETHESFGERKVAKHCQTGHFYFGFLQQIPEHCEHCDKPWAASNDVLLPRHGFSTAAWDQPKRQGTLDSHFGWSKTEVLWNLEHYEGEKSVSDFGGIQGLRATYREDGSLLVLNHGANQTGFVICTRCGYAESEPAEKKGSRQNRPLSDSFRMHLPLWKMGGKKTDHACLLEGHADPLRRQVLASSEPTDMLRLDFSATTLPGNDETFLTTLKLALHRAGAELLQLDPRELGGELIVSRSGHRDILIYDNVPGGAGHTRELIDEGLTWFQGALSLLHGTEDHHARCQGSCLDCILGFESQFAVESGYVDRHRVLRQLPENSLPMFDEFGYPLESSVLVQVKSQGGDDGWKVDGTDGSDDPGCR